MVGLDRRANLPRDTFAWKRGETTASAGELMAFSGFTRADTGALRLELL